MILTISILAIVALIVICAVKPEWLTFLGEKIFSQPALGIIVLVLALIGLFFIIGRIFGDMSMRWCQRRGRDRDR